MKALLLAREPNHGDSTPALLSVANRPLLCHALDWLAKGGIRDVAIMASDRIADAASDAVGDGSDWGFETHWMHRVPGETLGDSLSGLARFAGDGPVLVHQADSLTADPLEGLLGQAPVDEFGAVVLTRGAEPDAASVVSIHNGRRTGRGRSAGVAVFGGGVLSTLSDVDTAPGSELVALTDHLTAATRNVVFREVDRWWRYDGSAGAMLSGNRFALERLRGRPVEANVKDCIIEGPVSIDPSAQLESSTVRGPVVIGPGVRVVSAYLGPFTSVGANALIEGAEVENSVILAGASIAYLDTRLEGSVIGAGSRVFRDFRLPRAMRLNIGGGAEVAVT
ncbi:MAG: NDP-sugar synthase [Thermoleophilaceae bacterium]